MSQTMINPFHRSPKLTPSPTKVIVPPLSLSKPTTCLARKALIRWSAEANNQAISNDPDCSFQFEERQTAHDLHMLKLSKRYSKLYAPNVYKLNSATLVIQHWFMRQSLRRNEGKIEL